MDRISALRNLEKALGAFENGEIDLETMEDRVRGTVRTYSSSFEDGQLYRANGPTAVDGLIVIADSHREARERIRELADGEIERVEVDQVE